MCAMAESIYYSEVLDSDMENLKEKIRAQQQLLQKVYLELDEEREASSTAANEAMSMILRLQGEKAQLKMETSQYKREAEEKMCLAEESLAYFEDLLNQKEMEIALLEYQVQAYRYKLLGMGCSDIDLPEYKFPESLPQQRSFDPVFNELGGHRNVRRHDSLPSVSLRDFFPKKNTIERERSAIPITDLIPKIEVITNADQDVNMFSFDLEKRPGGSAGGDINPYRERIRKLDERVKEISDGRLPRRAVSASSGNRLRSCSVPPPDPAESSLSSSPIIDGLAPRLDQMKNSKNFVEKKPAFHAAASSSNVQDKFEIPQYNDSRKTRGLKEIEHKIFIPEGEKRNRKSVAEENLELQVKNKVPLPKLKDKAYKQRERIGSERQLSLPLTTNNVSEYQTEIERLLQRIERLESKESNTRQEFSFEGEAGVSMMKEILGQLNTLQSELRNNKTKKSNTLDDPSLISLTEAMLHFWL